MKHLQMQFNKGHWYRRHLSLLTAMLLPFSWLFGVLAAARRFGYRSKIIRSHRFNIPIIVIGNITVGGTGKTPCVVTLAQYFLANGFRPGIVSRGVGTIRHQKPFIVRPETSAAQAGDEAILLARHGQCPVVVCVDRVAAVKAMLQHYPACNLILSDDGLQHYRLQRDVEIAVIDGVRFFGNGQLLPAGPMREPLRRLAKTDYRIVNGGVMDGASQMMIEPKSWISVLTNEHREVRPVNSEKVHAVAGIGHPDKFFNLLREFGYEVIAHPFPDHHLFSAADFDFGDGLPVLMTEKDAVKCEKFADRRMWYLQIAAKLDETFLEQLKSRVS